MVKRSLKWEGGRRRGARTGVTLGSRDGEPVIFGVSTEKGRGWRNGRLCTVQLLKLSDLPLVPINVITLDMRRTGLGILITEVSTNRLVPGQRS